MSPGTIKRKSLAPEVVPLTSDSSVAYLASLHITSLLIWLKMCHYVNTLRWSQSTVHSIARTPTHQSCHHRTRHAPQTVLSCVSFRRILLPDLVSRKEDVGIFKQKRITFRIADRRSLEMRRDLKIMWSVLKSSKNDKKSTLRNNISKRERKERNNDIATDSRHTQEHTRFRQ